MVILELIHAKSPDYLLLAVKGKDVFIRLKTNIFCW